MNAFLHFYRRLLHRVARVSRHGYRVLVVVLFAAALSVFPATRLYLDPVAVTAAPTPQVPITLPSAPDIPVNETRLGAPAVAAHGVYIVDIPSGIALLDQGADQRFFPASTTKMMTALVAREQFHLDDVLTVSTVVTEGRVMDESPGERLTLESLLYAALVHSANDAAMTIAENHPAGFPGFIAAMNRKATQLQLDGTHFTNPVGFDDPQHYSTPRDLSKIALAVLADPVLAKIVSTRTITISDVTYTHFHPLTNVNELLGKVPGMSGVKTGYTDIAGGILISQVKRGDRSVLFVVLNSSDRFGDTESLVNWVFGNFRWHPAAEILPTSL